MDRRMGEARGDRGFTLIEVLIAVAVSAIVMAAVFAVYNLFFRQTTIDDMMVEAQQNARAAIDLIEREIVNTGYATASATVITEAAANSIEFTYMDPATDTELSATAGKRIRVRYALVTSDNITYLVRNMGICADTSCSSYSNTRQNEPVIPYVHSLQFVYYDMDGASFTPADQTQRDGVRFIDVDLATRTKANIPGTASPNTFTVKTHARLRNMDIGQTSADTSAPAVPTAFQVRDPGVCSRLKVKWTRNTEGDIAGYKIYYGTAASSYQGVVDVPLNVLSGSTYSCSQDATTVSCTIYPTLPALAYSPSTGLSDTMYYLALKAYDTSFNHSIATADVYGNPATSNPTFDSGANDSTINPVKPPAVTGFIGADGAVSGQVALGWTALDTAAYPDITGYRVYRSTQAFSSYPISATDPNVDWIAGETGSSRPKTLTKASNSLTDDTAGLQGCYVHYYAIAPVNCDATLVTDEGADPDAKKYIQSNYGITYGDGSAGSAVDSPAGSDTSPAETTVTGAPALSVAAGWRRVAASVTQPSDADLARTCVYVNEGSAYPGLRTDMGAYPLSSGCYQVDTSTTPAARLVPDSGGSFTTSELAQSQSAAFWHDSMTQETPPQPSLSDLGTYSYRAVSFDLCGNGSSVSAAQATTTLCGEDPTTGEKPPAVTNPALAACASPVTVSWTQVSSDTGMVSSPTNPYDLAGYRVFRSTSTDFSASTLISGSAPYWGSSYSDTGISDGGTYYYKIASTDCPYEKLDPTTATIRSDVLSGYLNSVQVGPVYPGRIDRDEKCPGSGGCTADDHREVLTGVTIDNSAGNGNGSSAPSTGLTHDTVTMFFENTSAAALTIETLSVSWTNSSNVLSKVTIGGGRSGVGQTFTNIPAGATTSVTGNDPYRRAVSNYNITDAQITAQRRYVPIIFEFDTDAGTPADTRDDMLLITLGVKNDTTATTGCLSYLTVSEYSEGVSVPFGPSVTATQQNQPASPTFSYAVPGDLGLNSVPNGSNGTVVVDGGAVVTVSADIAGNTVHAVTGQRVAVASATLYYIATAKTVTSVPAAGYTTVAMTNTAGNIWSAAIPAQDNMRVWYYILAIDNDGNFDRDPEVASGAYVYDQKTFNVCDLTPNAPEDLTATAAGADATLAWAAPLTYTTGASISGADPLTYRIFRNGVQIVASQAGLTYTDPGLATGVYSYYVKALNSCATPGPNVSVASNTAATCVGTSSQATMSVAPTSIYQGDPFTVTIMDCLAISGARSTTVETINVTTSFTGFYTRSLWPETYAPTIVETGPATGLFVKEIETTGQVAESGKLHVLSSDTVTVYYPYSSPQSIPVTVTVDPCIDIPKAPTGLTGTTTGNTVNLSWSAVTQNTDNSAITDLAGYRIYEKVTNNSDVLVKDWFLRTTVGSGTTSQPLGADQGNLNQRKYYFKITATDSCATPNESAYSNTWMETS